MSDILQLFHFDLLDQRRQLQDGRFEMDHCQLKYNEYNGRRDLKHKPLAMRRDCSGGR